LLTRGSVVWRISFLSTAVGVVLAVLGFLKH
jgi:hypothetical protein